VVLELESWLEAARRLQAAAPAPLLRVVRARVVPAQPPRVAAAAEVQALPLQQARAQLEELERRVTTTRVSPSAARADLRVRVVAAQVPAVHRAAQADRAVRVADPVRAADPDAAEQAEQAEQAREVPEVAVRDRRPVPACEATLT
jgi:hypothetical protein